MKINKTSNEIAIESLSEIEELIQSEVFSIGDALKEEAFIIALKYSIVKLKEAELFFKGGK